MTARYPRRDPYYSHKFTRLLFKSCAAMEMGQDAVLLCIHIAHTEDAAKYSGPVRFWNSQLNEVLGFLSPKSLNNARKRAVQSGWLHYERKSDKVVGLYWTLIPARVAKFDDTPIEESEYSGSIPSTEQKAEQEQVFHSKYGTHPGTHPGTHNDPHSIPIPKPKRERSRFSPPGVEEIRDYLRELGSGGKVTSEAIHDHYQANGWRVGNSPMRDWKAAVRQWVRREGEFSKTPQSPVATPKKAVEYPDFTGKGRRA